MFSPENIKISRSAELEPKVSVERYLNNLRRDIGDEIERITKEERLLGEGKAAEVFLVKRLRRSHRDACIKVWRPELEKLKGQDPVEYSKRQTLEPEDEFKLQDELYTKGFTAIPRPLAYADMNGIHAMAMERVHGYTLQELQENDIEIADPSWNKLEKLLIELTKEYGVVHRDLHAGNIMIETTDDISKTKTVSGTLKFIDFGLSKRIYGSPSPEDFQLTLGNNVIRYTEDKQNVERFKPTRGNHNVFAH